MLRLANHMSWPYGPSGYNQTDGTLGMLRFLRIHPAYRGYQMSEAYH
jgi:hypothetical protein